MESDTMLAAQVAHGAVGPGVPGAETGYARMLQRLADAGLQMAEGLAEQQEDNLAHRYAPVLAERALATRREIERWHTLPPGSQKDQALQRASAEWSRFGTVLAEQATLSAWESLPPCASCRLPSDAGDRRTCRHCHEAQSTAAARSEAR